jgi:hypothetical protein
MIASLCETVVTFCSISRQKQSGTPVLSSSQTLSLANFWQQSTCFQLRDCHRVSFNSDVSSASSVTNWSLHDDHHSFRHAVWNLVSAHSQQERERNTAHGMTSGWGPITESSLQLQVEAYILNFNYTVTKPNETLSCMQVLARTATDKHAHQSAPEVPGMKFPSESVTPYSMSIINRMHYRIAHTVKARCRHNFL